MNKLINRYTINGDKWCKSSDVEDLEKILKLFSDIEKGQAQLDEAKRESARLTKVYNICKLIAFVSAACLIYSVYKVSAYVGWL